MQRVFFAKIMASLIFVTDHLNGRVKSVSASKSRSAILKQKVIFYSNSTSKLRPAILK
jgi:hypothetical protein